MKGSHTRSCNRCAPINVGRIPSVQDRVHCEASEALDSEQMRIGLLCVLLGKTLGTYDAAVDVGWRRVTHPRRFTHVTTTTAIATQQTMTATTMPAIDPAVSRLLSSPTSETRDQNNRLAADTRAGPVGGRAAWRKI